MNQFDSLEFDTGGIDWEAWKSESADAYTPPSAPELGLVESFIDHHYRRIYVEREINLMDMYRNAINYTAGVAKKSLSDAMIAGGDPKKDNQIAVTDFNPAYVGFNDWEGNITGANNTIQTVFDASAPNVAGTAGKELNVGSLCGAHLIVGFEQRGYEAGGTGKHACKALRFYKNDDKETITTLGVNASTDTKITLLEVPKLLVGGDTHTSFRLTGYLSGAATVLTDTIIPIGISFINSKISRNLLPSLYASSTSSADISVVY